MNLDRPYQTRTIEAIRKQIGLGKRRILVAAPTGCGKGYIASRVMEMCREKGSPNVFFAAQRELIYQLQAQLDRLTVPSRVIMAGVKDEFHSYDEADTDCWLVAKDTLNARAFQRSKIAPPAAKLIQVDEAHQSLADVYQAIMGHYSDSIVLGWTATPCRTDGRGLGEYFDCMIQAVTYSELQKDGWLVPVRVFAPDRPDLKGMKVSRGDYAKGQLEKRMNRDEMVGSIIEEWKKNANDRQTVVFASGVQHSIHIRNEFLKIGVPCEHIDGKMKTDQREEVMAGVRDGSTTVVCNYGVMTTGVDVPSLKYMVCARPTKSFLLWRQMGGRIQRPADGHDHCCIARGSLVLTDRGNVPIEDVKLDDLVWDGVDFVSHYGILYKGTQTAIMYSGLTATPDHKVLTDEGWKTIAAAAGRNKRLVRGSIGRTPVRVSDHSNPHDSRPRCTDGSRSGLLAMWGTFVDSLSQLGAAATSGLQMLPSGLGRTLPRMALSTRCPPIPSMHRPERHWIFALRRAGNRVSFQDSLRGCVLDSGTSWNSKEEPEYHDRPDKQQWALRAGQSAMGNSQPANEKPRTVHSKKFTVSQIPCRVPGRGIRQKLSRSAISSGLNSSTDCGTMAVEVFDIVNCGPRSRFCVNGVIVANCIQDHSDNALHFGFPDEDVEWSLAAKDRAQDLPRTERNSVETDELTVKDPYACEKCGAKYRGPHCPACGHIPQRSGKEVGMSKGDLKELERSKCNAAATPMDKQKTWDECLGWAVGTNKKVGAAAWRYKDKYGVFPNSRIQNTPRNSQWQMMARDFYREVIKPAKEQNKKEFALFGSSERD